MEIKNKIMVIDDDVSIIKIIEFSLSQKGFDVHTFNNGESALEKAMQESFDFFLVDLVLPGMHGFEFVRKLKTNPMYSRTPVLIITARMEASDEEVAKNAGANGVLIKPFSLEDMSERITELLSI